MTGILWYDTVVCILVFIFGAVIGSFLNVVIYRTPLKMSIISGPSHCFSCGEKIKPYDLVPIFSWIFLGGKCRNCKAPISARYTIVEALTGFSFLAAYLRFHASLPMVVAIVFFCLLIVLSCIDLDTLEIPYWCTISIAVLGIATFFTEPNMPWWEHFAGAAVIAVPFAVLALFGGMGGGDVQLMAACGFMLGWKIVPAAVIGVICGAIYGIFQTAITSKRDKSISASISVVFGDWLKTDGEKMVESSSDIVVGEIEKGVCKVNTEIFDEKAWINGKPSDEQINELNESISKLVGDVPKNKEFVFRITAENNTVKKVKFRQRIAFGPALSVGLAISALHGEMIIKWYLDLMGIR